jgi:pimeloyl-ACP methyl ester carboxylesterase
MFVWDAVLSLIVIVVLLPLSIIRFIHQLWTRVWFRDSVADSYVDGFYQEMDKWCKLVEIRPGRVINLLDTRAKTTTPTIVFCHGACSRMGHFNELIKHYHSERYRVVAFDMVGCGRSPKPSDADYSLPSHFEDLQAVIDTYCTSSFILIGHSAGACLSLTLATRASKNLLRVVALSPIGPSDYDKVTDYLTRSFSAPMALAWLLRPIIGHFWRQRMFAASASKRVIATSVEASLRNPVHMYVNFYRSFRLPALEGLATRPVLILSGTEDKVTPPSGGWEAAQVLGTHARMVEITEAGHAIADEQPEKVIAEINRFITTSTS